MGLSDEAIAEELKAGQQGWQQNAMGWINAIKPGGKVGGATFGGGGGG